MIELELDRTRLFLCLNGSGTRIKNWMVEFGYVGVYLKTHVGSLDVSF